MDSIELLKIAWAVLALAVAIIGHEIMHGLVAYLYGDSTAKNLGRLSINPIVHVDLVGTIIVPLSMYFLPMLMGADSGFLFGWAKPVPIDMRKVHSKGGYNATMQVDLAGIVYNFTLGVIASIVLLNMSQPTNLDSLTYVFAYIFIYQLLIINIVLAIFNLLPIPQFDGAHFISHLGLKYGVNSISNFYTKYDRYGIIVVLVVLMTPLKDYLLLMPVQTILQLLTT